MDTGKNAKAATPIELELAGQIYDIYMQVNADAFVQGDPRQGPYGAGESHMGLVED
jgi:hypothetical protein